MFSIMSNTTIDISTLTEESLHVSTNHRAKRLPGFDESHALHELKHYLPTQTPLKDFIHHNSLHAFQNLKFFDAIFKASKIFGYQVTLQLSEYRKLFKEGRIKSEILDQVITKRHGSANVSDWRTKLTSHPYDSCNYARIGQLRSNWKSQYGIDL